MSIIDSLRGIFFPTWDERALGPNELWATGADIGLWSSTASSGEPVTSATIMRAAAGACIRLLADDISALPLDVYRKVGNDAEPIEKPDWMERPDGSRFSTSADLISDIVMSMGGNGSAFVYCLPDIENPVLVEVLDPELTSVEKRLTGRIYRNAGIPGAVADDMKIAQIDWVRRPGTFRGMSPIEASRESSGLELAAQRWAGAFFRNGGTLGGIVSVPGGPETVDAEKLRQQFAARHTGSDNWWKPAVLTGGAEFSDTTASPKDADLEPLWRHVVEEAARLYHIPPHLLGSQTSGAQSYASVEQKSIEYVIHAVVPFTTRIERVLSRLVPGDDTYVKLNVNALMRGDSKSRAEWYRTMADLKVMKPKTIAALEDLPPSEAIEGFHETPNNTPQPERTAIPSLIDARTGVDVSPTLRLDSVHIGDDAARQMAEASTQGMAEGLRQWGAGMEARDNAIVNAIADSVQLMGDQYEDLQAVKAELAAAREREAERDAPEIIELERDANGKPLRQRIRKGSRVSTREMRYDENGRLVGIA